MRARRVRRVLRWLLIGGAVVLALLLVGAVLVGWGLRSPGVRAQLLARVTVLVEERLGLAMAAEDFRLRPLGGSLEVDALTVAVPGSPPFFEVRRAAVVASPRALLRGEVRIGALALDAPRLDLRQPLPVAGEEEDAEPAEPAWPEIAALEIRDGRIEAAVPEALRERVADWRVEGVTVSGSLVAGRLELALEGAALAATQTGGRPRRLEATARLVGPMAGPLDLERARVAGEGIEISVSGRLGLAEEQPLELAFEAEADAGRLLSLDPESGRVTAAGRLDLRRSAGRVELAAPSIAAAALRPWLDPALWERLGADGDRLALDADVELGPGSLEPSAGGAEIAWRRQDRPLVEARAGLASSAARAAIDFEAKLLAAAPGRREISGRLEAPELARLAEGSLRDGRFALDTPDLAALLDRLRGLFPSLLPEIPPDVRLAGALAAAGSFQGPLADPAIDGRLDWRPAPGSRIGLEAAGRPLTRSGEAKLALDAVEIPALVPALVGQVSGRGRIAAGAAGVRAEVELDGAELGRAGEPALLDRLRLEAASDGRLLTIGRLAAARGELALDAEGEIAAGRGTLRVRAPRLAAAGVELAAEAELPATLAPALFAALGGTGAPAAEAWSVAWSTPEADWAPLLAALGVAGGPEKLRLATEGSLRLAPAAPAAGEGQVRIGSLETLWQGRGLAAGSPLELRLAGGRLELDETRLAGEGVEVALGAAADLDAGWAPGAPIGELVRSLDVAGRGQVGAEWLVRALDGAAGEGTLGFELSASGPPDDLRAELGLEGPEASLALAAPLAVRLASPSLSLALAGATMTLREARVRVNDEPLGAEGVVRFGDGALEIDLPRLDFAGLTAALGGEIPLAGGETEGAAEAAAYSLRWSVEEGDWLRPLAALGLAGEEGELRAASRGRLRLDPARPAAAEAEIEISRLALAAAGRRVIGPEPWRLSLAEGRLETGELRLRGGESDVSLRASCRLAEDWRPGEPLAFLIQDLGVEGEGDLDGALLNPFLAGGVAEGHLALALSARGDLDALEGRARIDGPEASITFLSPYVARLRGPELELALADGRITLTRGRLSLNDGDVELSGWLAGEGAARGAARFDGVRFRLDYGLLVELAGDLRLIAQPGARPRLEGEVIVDRGLLARPLELDRRLVNELLAPVDLAGTEKDPLEALDLDLEVTTREGVRVRNNLADLLVRWDLLSVTGNPIEPVIEGLVEVDPGGLVFAYGQTVRLDSASLDFPGDPLVPPRIELETTTSFEDPSIGRLAGEDPLTAGTATPAEAAGLEAFTGGLATFYGEQIASRLSESLGDTRISLRPVLIFGETDPGARLTVSRDFSTNFALAASIDLRNAEAQTYLLDLHDFDRLPRFRGQIFTNDEGDEGTTLQQRLTFGGEPRRRDARRLARLRLEPLPGVSKRSLKRAVGYEKGDALDDGAAFEIEVAVGELMRRRGYPDARVEAELEPVAGKASRMALRLDIRPGPRVRFAFTGDPLPSRLQRTVTSLYRADFYEPVSIEEMRSQAVRAFRSLGALEPEIGIEVEPLADDGEEGRGYDRLVTVHAAAGRRVDLGPPVFEGVPEEVAAALTGRFPGPVERVELAVGGADADARVIDTLVRLGYPNPWIVTRNISEDGRSLVVGLEAGPRRIIASVDLRGAPGEEAAELLASAALEVGAPARGDLLARAAVAVEDDLRRRGFADAAVRIQAQPAADDRPLDTAVVLDVEPGERFEVGELRFEGLRATRRRWLAGVADLEPGELLRREQVLAARRRIRSTGLFRSVLSDLEPLEPSRRAVRFLVEEADRFQLAYGVRWESGADASALVEATDRNFLGRGITLGLRALYAGDDESLRAFTQVPRLFGTRNSLEVYGLLREEVSDGIITEQAELTLQLSREVGRDYTARIYGRYRDTHLFEVDPDPFFPFDVRIKTPLLGTQLLYDTRGGEVLPSRGVFASVDLSGSDTFLGGDLRYARLFTQASLFLPAGRPLGRRLTWAQSVRVGVAEAFDQQIAPPLLFSAGGEYSLRGFPANGLRIEVVNPDGTTRLTNRAAHLLLINQELRLAVTEDYTALLFADAGNLWEERGDFGSDLQWSVGLGLRALTPVGLLRLDFAKLVDPRDFDPDYKIHFGFGNAF